MSSWVACIPSLSHGCIDNAGTSFDVSNKGILTPNVFPSDIKDKGGFYPRTSISQKRLLGEIRSSPMSSEHHYLVCGERCRMGLSHFGCEEPVSFSGQHLQRSTGVSPIPDGEVIRQESNLAES